MRWLGRKRGDDVKPEAVAPDGERVEGEVIEARKLVGIIRSDDVGGLTYEDIWGRYFSDGEGALASGSPQAAMACAPFWRGMHFLAQSIASVPLHVYRRTDDEGGKERVRDQLARNVGQYWTDDLTRYDGMRWLVQQSILHGVAYAEVVRGVRARVAGIQPLETRAVAVTRVNGRKRYEYSPGDREGTPNGKRLIPPDRLIELHFAVSDNLLDYYSPVVRLRRAIDLWLALEQYASSFFRNGGVPPLLVEMAVSSEKVARRAKAQITEAVKKSNTKGDLIMFLPPEVKVVPIAYKPQEGQLIDSRRFQLEEIARVLGVPPVFLQDLTRATYSNVVQQDLHAVKHVLSKWCEQIEAQLNLKLFGREEESLFVEFDLSGLERGDFKSRVEGLTKMIQSGQLTPNEARAIENRPPAPEEEAGKLFMQGATLPIDSLPNPAEMDAAKIDVMKNPPKPPAPAPAGSGGKSGGASSGAGASSAAKPKPKISAVK